MRGSCKLYQFDRPSRDHPVSKSTQSNFAFRIEAVFVEARDRKSRFDLATD
jgi:hypothetical protein